MGFLSLCIVTGLAMDQSMGYPLFMYGIPFASAAWVGALAVTRSVSWPARTTIVLLGILAVLSVTQLFRQEGTDGSLRSKLVLRWQPRQEDAALEALRQHRQSLPTDEPPDTVADSVPSGSDWAEFRGPHRNGKVMGVQIETDWSMRPPIQRWRRPVGPGWSSFAVVANRAYTQEQRGDQEAVVCYDLASGREIWAHLDPAKFSEPMGGVGPRATPNVVDDKLYALGAEGNLKCLEPATGQLLWSSRITSDTGAKLPEWGFASSPLVVGDLVVVYAGAPDAGMIAYDRLSGQKVWTCPAGSHSYSSAQQTTLEKNDHLILMMSNSGLTAAEIASGKPLWQYDWSSDDQARIVQPAVLPDGDLLIATGYGIGTRRIAPRKVAGKWEVQTVWESRNFKPYFNDFVCHGGYVYGFDDKILACIDPATADRAWKGGRYGYGQLLLLVDQDLLLVLSEKGDIALVDAKPEGYKQRARLHALDGKTWNHPVVAHGKLLVRNAEEAVCYELPLKAMPGPDMLAEPEE